MLEILEGVAGLEGVFGTTRFSCVPGVLRKDDTREFPEWESGNVRCRVDEWQISRQRRIYEDFELNLATTPPSTLGYVARKDVSFT